jgi:hypothetical protein
VWEGPSDLYVGRVFLIAMVWAWLLCLSLGFVTLLAGFWVSPRGKGSSPILTKPLCSASGLWVFDAVDDRHTLRVTKQLRHMRILCICDFVW